MGGPKQCLRSNIKTPDFSFMVHTIARGTRVVPAIIVVFPALPVSCLRSVIGGMYEEQQPRFRHAHREASSHTPE